MFAHAFTIAGAGVPPSAVIVPRPDRDAPARRIALAAIDPTPARAALLNPARCAKIVPDPARDANPPMYPVAAIDPLPDRTAVWSTVA